MNVLNLNRLIHFFKFPPFLALSSLSDVSLIVYLAFCFFRSGEEDDALRQQGCLGALRCTTLPALLVHLVINVACQKGPRDWRREDGFTG